jgi:hypothetical protein
MIYRLRIKSPKLPWPVCAGKPPYDMVGKFGTDIDSYSCGTKCPVEFINLEAAIERSGSNWLWNFEVVYRDVNGDWKPVNLYSIESNCEFISNHICPSCGGAVVIN